VKAIGSSTVAPQVSVDPASTSTRSALLFVYISYFARYVQLFILIPLFGRVLGPAEYGRVLAAMSLFNIVWMVVQYGFPPVGLRDLVNARTPEAVGRHFGAQISARLLASIAGIGIGALGIAFSPLLMDNAVYGIVAVALGVVSAFNLGWFFQAVHRFRTSVLLEVAGFAITVVLTLTLVRDSSDGLFVLLSLLVSSVITLAAAYALALQHVDVRQIRFAGARSLIDRSGAIFVSTGVPLLMTSASSYLLAFFATSEEVGFFGAAERLATVVLSVMAPAGQVLTATVAKRLSSPGTQSDAYTLMRKAVLLMVCFGMLACAAAWVLSPRLLPVVLGPGFSASIGITQMLALTFPLVAFSQAVRMYVLFPLNEDKSLLWSALSGAFLNVLAILTLANQFGGTGVAAARVLGELVTAAMLAIALTRTKIAGRIFGT
jgi:O-antigen/teichoic acid export membrane protein